MEEGLLFNIIIWLFLIEIAVGAIQLIGALIRTIIKLNSNQPLVKLKTYWIVVAIYFIVLISLYFISIYFLEKSFANSSERYDANTGMYDYSKQNLASDYFLYQKYINGLFIGWVVLAWLIAFWYLKNIVFVKSIKKTFKHEIL